MRCFLKIVAYVIFAVLAIWLLTFTVYNHDLLSLNLWPLPYALSLSAGVLLILCLAVGYLIGYVHRWCRQSCGKKA